MPKLTMAAAMAVDSAEAAGGFPLLDEGRYAAQLMKVEQKDGKEFPYWVWEFSNVHDEEGTSYAGRLWNNTSLSPKSAGFLKAVFEAFGYTTDSDTDEMVGEFVVVHVIQEVIPTGQRAGQKTNRIQRFAEFDPNEWDFDPADFPVKGSDADY